MLLIFSSRDEGYLESQQLNLTAMSVTIKHCTPSQYDTGVHPEVTEMFYERDERLEENAPFFAGNRFPNLRKLSFETDNLYDVNLAFENLEILNISCANLYGLTLKCPNLRVLDCSDTSIEELSLNCPLLKSLCCADCSAMKRLILNCPSLEILECYDSYACEEKITVLMGCSDEIVKPGSVRINSTSLLWLDLHGRELDELVLNCPHLKGLSCYDTGITDLNGLEYCSGLEALEHDEKQEDAVKIIHWHLPGLSLYYWPDAMNYYKSGSFRLHRASKEACLPI